MIVGRHPASHAEQGRGQGQALRPLVLQEGTRIFEPSPKEDEELAEEDQTRKARRLRGRSLRALRRFHHNQVLLICTQLNLIKKIILTMGDNFRGVVERSKKCSSAL